MRDRYLKQLRLVHDDLLRMGSRVEHSLVSRGRSRKLGRCSTAGTLSRQVASRCASGAPRRW